jgi:hypothetical protein
MLPMRRMHFGGVSTREVGRFIDWDVPIADRHPAVDMRRGTGDDIEAFGVFDIILFGDHLPARHGNVGEYRQFNRQ